MAVRRDVTQADLDVPTLGPTRIDSPLSAVLADRGRSHYHVDESDRVLFDDTAAMISARGVPLEALPGFEPGGPRRKIYFDPTKTRVGIVTCGGLCPGVNDVIRGLVHSLTQHYGVHRITGFRNGYRGFIAKYGYEVVDLTPESVEGIDERGGTILGTSRGEQDAEQIVDCLERMNINILFTIGGDGTMRGAMNIAKVISERGSRIAVVGVPKTIDNDIPYIQHSFGFQTAFARAAEFIRAARVEAASTPNGVSIVRVMGRHSGFIASYATLAASQADVVLLPEVPFSLHGPDGVLAYVRRLVKDQGNAVIVVAEGAGQELMADAPHAFDASGNIKLHDVGALLRDEVIKEFAHAGVDVTVRYLDPSYTIRSVPANPYDRVYCLRLAHAAVHAAMSGRTEVTVGRWNGRFVHVPMPLVVSGRNQVDPDGDLWLGVLEVTGQPAQFGTEPEDLVPETFAV